jgi:MFS family permease
MTRRWNSRSLPRTQRTLAAAILITTLGNGMYLAASALFLVRSVGLSLAQVSVGLSVAGAAGLIAGIPLGRLADRRGPREVYVVTLVAEGLSTAALVLVHSFAMFLVVGVLVGLSEQGSRAVRGALIAQVGGAQRTSFRAYLRSVTNVGLSVGTLAAGLAIHADTRSAYLALILADALSFLLTAAVVSRLPHVAVAPAAGKRARLGGLRDRGYLTVAFLYGLLAVQYPLLTVVLPLWILQHTAAPAWVISPLIVANTVVVVVFQVRASRDIHAVADAARATRQAGWLLMIGSALFAITGLLPVGAAIGVLAVGVLVSTFAEIRYAAASFEVAFTLAPPDAQGEYQGLFELGTGGFVALAPLLLINLCIVWGAPGWLVLGAMLAGTSIAAARVAVREDHIRQTSTTVIV